MIVYYKCGYSRKPLIGQMSRNTLLVDIITVRNVVAARPGTATAADGTHPTGMHSCYRPQRSWGKVMFLQASVILLTGGGYLTPPPGADPLRDQTLPFPPEQTPPGTRPPDQTPPRSRTPPDQTPPSHKGDFSMSKSFYTLSKDWETAFWSS